MERHRGIVFLATNRPYDLDEAMHRRITLVVEFHPPDHLLRVDIWKSLLPPKLPLAEGIDLKKIALKYEVGGRWLFWSYFDDLDEALGFAEKS
jgi:SpoVK/Ycf46/Vps4 family AAA+-type ATPase